MSSGSFVYDKRQLSEISVFFVADDWVCNIEEMVPVTPDAVGSEQLAIPPRIMNVATAICRAHDRVDCDAADIQTGCHRGMYIVQ